MQRVHLAIWVALLSVAVSAAAGDVWINCEPGFEIFLDGESVGVSETDVSGMDLRGIEAGAHTIRIEKNGIAMAEFSVKVGFDPNQVEVGELASGMSEEDPATSQGAVGNRLLGTIEITSDPKECNVKIGSRRIQKKHPVLTIPGIPIGEHKLWFESSGTVLSEKVVVQAVQPTRITVDIHNRQVAISKEDSDVEGDDSAAETQSAQAEPGCIEYWIEVLRTNDLEAIDAYQGILRDLGFPKEQQKVITIEVGEAEPEFKLRVGPIPLSRTAKWAAGQIRNAGIPSVWVVPDECLPPSERPKREFRPKTGGG